MRPSSPSCGGAYPRSVPSDDGDTPLGDRKHWGVSRAGTPLSLRPDFHISCRGRPRANNLWPIPMDPPRRHFSTVWGPTYQAREEFVRIARCQVAEEGDCAAYREHCCLVSGDAGPRNACQRIRNARSGIIGLNGSAARHGRLGTALLWQAMARCLSGGSEIAGSCGGRPAGRPQTVK